MRIQISLNFFQLEGDYNHYEIQEIITSKRSCFQPFSLFHEQQEQQAQQAEAAESLSSVL